MVAAAAAGYGLAHGTAGAWATRGCRCPRCDYDDHGAAAHESVRAHRQHPAGWQPIGWPQPDPDGEAERM